MKRIAVVARQKEYAEYLRNNLGQFLDKFADIRCYSLKEVENLSHFEEEYVAVSAYTLFLNIRDKVRQNTEMIILGLVLTRENAACIADVPDGTRALLVNMDYRTCMQIITNLYSIGFRDIELVPYYGEGEYDHSICLAITADEMEKVPEDMPQVINIGERSIDMNCIIDIAGRLGVEGLFRSSDAFRLAKSVYFSNDSMEVLLGENQNLAGRLEGLIRVMKQGIFLTDAMGSVLLCNEKAAALVNSTPEELAGFNFMDIVSGVDMTEAQKDTEQVIRVGRETLVATVTEIKIDQKRSGVIITLDDFEEMEEKQHGLRSRISQVNHEARYHFEDIKGKSAAMREVVTVAKRVSRSDSSVLITGESGTGKEVFAQSIHNESTRGHYNFVAVNCAAIPENLLESEMFGYEEGSFTGARKGGKIGYFELAHQGTIFLDEIAELPLMLQSKLLRVIEEKKIIKIGAHKAVNVDVRIITATNRDLYAMTENGTFREDLYYRLNVLPVQIPSLRERPSDIEELLDYFLEKQHVAIDFTEEAMAFLIGYPWRGNVRELRNAVEYMVSLEKERIDSADLPVLIRRWAAGLPENSHGQHNTGKAFISGEPKEAEKFYKEHVNERSHVERFLLGEGKNASLYAFVLSELERAWEERSRIGRASLEQAAREKGLFYSEPEIRSALRKLSQGGFVHSTRGRGGSSITDEGRKLGEKIKTIIGE